MKRYTFLVYHKQYLEFLEKIRDLGVLHIIEKPDGIAENDALREKMQFSARIKTAIKQLEKLLPKGVDPKPGNNDFDAPTLLTNIENAFAEKESLQQKIVATEKEADRMEVWGDFSHKRIEELKDSGFVLGFYACSQRRFDQEWEVKYNAFEVDTVGATIYFVTVTRPGEVVDIDADPVKLSDFTAIELQNQVVELREQLENQKKMLVELAVDEFNNLKIAQQQAVEKVDFAKVVLNTEKEAEEKVMLLQGWCPEEAETALNEYLESTDIYYETEDPTEEDKVPIKLKNNKFARLYEMIGELYDLPNYHEIDLTPFFAPFYMLFFGLCLGDAGYGLLLLLLAIIMRPKVKEGLKPVMSLLIWLGGATVVMGTVSSTFFGYNLLDSKIEWIEKIKFMMLDPNQLFYTSLIIGVVQILFGMTIKAVGQVRRYGWSASFATWGWMILILGNGGTYLAATYAGLNPTIAKYMYIGFCSLGGLFVFILNDIKRNPLINIGAGLWDAYNMVTGMLGDVLSYIRLFALGISGAVMGFVFNDLAFNLSPDIPVVKQLVVLIILLLGHGINIFMSSLSAFVHPMRLTFVEFYKNSGFEGGGKKYKPFSRYKEEQKLF
ncbi:MAG: V-type ATPase 116kDa subunit family protein [Paludibacter sp.]|nr:V-type ATPase 116kDa subunit family protein [Paludibacter sp.]